MNSRKMKHVLIPWDFSAAEKAENFLIHEFNERYNQMSELEKQADIVQDELELLWALRSLRARKNRPQIKRIKEELYAKGMIGLTEDEWNRYQRTGRTSHKVRVRRKVAH